MSMLLPSDDSLYAALVARDPSFDGRAWVGVTSTGILCRLTCPARKPMRANCRFFPSLAEGIVAGFRPCLRCKPLSDPGADPLVARLLAMVEADPGRRWREADLIAMRLDPSTVRRSFRRTLGLSFLDYARTRRLQAGFTTLAEGGKVIDAQLDAGFSSPSAFRLAFARLLGQPPGDFATDALLRADWIDTPLGSMVAVTDERALYLLEFIDRKALPAELRALARASKGRIGIGSTGVTEQLRAELGRYFRGEGAAFATRLSPLGTPFQRAVWDQLRQVPPGRTVSYSALAERLGRPQAVRAVARANGANPISLLIPCHRVIGADGSLTGYGGGLWRKDRLLAIEREIGATHEL